MSPRPVQTKPTWSTGPAFIYYYCPSPRLESLTLWLHPLFIIIYHHFMTRAWFLGVFTVCACEAPWSEMEVEFGVNVNVRISTREHGIS